MKLTDLTRAGRKLLPLQYCGAVIVAAGTASRMGGVDKIMTPLKEEPVIVHTVRAFENCDAISEIVIVTRQELIAPIRVLCADFSKVKAVVVGGQNRVESVQNGLSALSKKVKLAAVHDGARPLVTWQLIDRVVRAANSYSAAVPVLALKDTIKAVKGGVVSHTPDRNTLRCVQTPQVFAFDLLRAALKKAQDENAQITDDASAVERLGMGVKIVEGDERNIKITTPMDLKLAQLLMEDET